MHQRDADQPSHRHRPLHEALWAGGAAVLAIVVAGWRVGAPSALTGVWGGFDLTTSYAGARSLGEHLQPFVNPDLAFPFGQDLAGFPAPDLLNVATMTVLARVAGDPVVAINLYLVLGFGLVALATYALLRVVRVPPAVAASLAFAFSLLPWHFERFTHASLANYSTVSIGLILVVAVLSWNLALGGEERAPARTLLVALALALYVGLTGTYYAVFVTIIALTALIFQILLGRRGRDLLPAAWLALLPTLISGAAALSYRLMASESAPSAVSRVPEESQLYGGALFTLVRTTDLWSSGWPIPGLGLVPTVASRLEADARNSTLGLIAVVLAFAAAGLILAANGMDRRNGLVASLGYWPWLFMISLLFFVAGGFGQAFAFMTAFQIRSWGRMSIMVIGIAFVVLGLSITYLMGRWRRPRAIGVIASAAILGLTLADVASMPAPVDVAAANRQADELRQYGAALDSALPDGCGVFTLPAYLFPEGDPGDGTATYDPLLPYLFAQGPRWSYGGVRGSHAGDWQFEDVSRHVPTLVAQVTAAGFCAIQVDTFAFDAATSPVADLERLLGGPVAVSGSGRWLTYSLAQASAAPFTEDYVFDPVFVVPAFGFDEPRALRSEVTSTLLTPEGALLVLNPRSASVNGTVAFEMTSTGCADEAVIVVSTATDTRQVAGNRSEAVELPVVAPAGETTAIHLSAPADCRVWVVNPRFLPQ